MELDIFMIPKFLTYHLKLLFAAHHYVFNSKDPKAIADVLCVKKRKVQRWMQSFEWIEAVSYWSGSRPNNGEDLNLAEKVWTEMIENGEDLSAIDFPEIQFKRSKDSDPNVYALLNSHLFCIDNLCASEIRSQIHAERPLGSPPVRYEGQRLENAYHYWLYPNEPEGLYSKVLARANVVGDLVIGTGEDTSLVIIRHGRLTLTRQAANDVANISDERLLVCL